MRPILILFVMGATGFGFILQKKDVPEPATTKSKAGQLRQTSATSWSKHSINQSPVVAQNNRN